MAAPEPERGALRGAALGARDRPGRGRRDRRQRGAGRGLLAAARHRSPRPRRRTARPPSTTFRSPVADMAALHDRGGGDGRGALPRHPGHRLRPSRRRQRPFQRPRAGGRGRRPGSRARAQAVTAFVHDLVTAAGGSISAEHGIGQMKLAELARLGDPARLAAMRAIKRALDPKGIMNPASSCRLASGKLAKAFAHRGLRLKSRGRASGRSQTSWRLTHGDPAAAQSAAFLQEPAAALEQPPRQATSRARPTRRPISPTPTRSR